MCRSLNRLRIEHVTSNYFDLLANVSLLQDFGVRLIIDDPPGFGESDPHPRRNLDSSTLDILRGSMHAWAALKYILDGIASAFMVAPMFNPYELSMAKEDKSRSWEK
ncbi:hypothetical protein LguiB_031301 [Lonicera macranthoides]